MSLDPIHEDSPGCNTVGFNPPTSTNPVADMTFDIGSSSSVQSLNHITRLYGFNSLVCSFTTSLTSSQSFLTYNSGNNELVLSSTDACEIGDYSAPTDTFQVTLVPSETPKVRADEVYTFSVSITCPITDVAVGGSLPDINM